MCTIKKNEGKKKLQTSRDAIQDTKYHTIKNVCAQHFLFLFYIPNNREQVDSNSDWKFVLR